MINVIGLNGPAKGIVIHGLKNGPHTPGVEGAAQLLRGLLRQADLFKDLPQEQTGPPFIVIAVTDLGDEDDHQRIPAFKIYWKFADAPTAYQVRQRLEIDAERFGSAGDNLQSYVRMPALPELEIDFDDKPYHPYQDAPRECLAELRLAWFVHCTDSLSGDYWKVLSPADWGDMLDATYATAHQDLKDGSVETELADWVAAKLPLVECKFCHRQIRRDTAHRHQHRWVGDVCCWDECLRSSE